MSELALSALYQGGNRKPGRSYTLRLLSGVSDRNNIHITNAAAAQVGGAGRIFDLSPRGVILADGATVSLHCIKIRTTGEKTGCLHRVYLAQREIIDLSTEFGLIGQSGRPEVQVTDQSYFVFLDGRRFDADVFNVSPIWHELLEPRWRQAFLAYVHDAVKNPLPDPSRFPWRSFTHDRLTMPALDRILNFRMADKKIVEGELDLSIVDGTARARFVYPGGASHYLLKENDIEYLGKSRSNGQSEAAGARAADAAEEFDKQIFLKLFGNQPQLSEYSCRREAGIGRGRIYFMALKKEPFELLPSIDAPWKEGEKIYFTFVRKNSHLLIYCYRDEARQNLFGGVRIALIDGFPNRRGAVIQKPDCLREQP